MRSPLIIASWIALVMAAVFVTPASSETLIVSAKANIFGAGHGIPPGPGGGGGGILPPRFDLPPGSNRVQTFSSVTGIVNCCSGVPDFNNGPDGRPPAGDFTNINSFGGISGIIHNNRVMFMVGIYLDGSEPKDSAPPRLNFTGADNFTELFPALNQIFFIGDGLTGTGSGSVQLFHIPDSATRVYLGFADASSFQGAPGFYDDNKGSLTATFTVTSVAAVHKPNSLMLAVPGCINAVDDANAEMQLATEEHMPACNEVFLQEVLSLRRVSRPSQMSAPPRMLSMAWSNTRIWTSVRDWLG